MCSGETVGLSKMSPFFFLRQEALLNKNASYLPPASLAVAFPTLCSRGSTGHLTGECAPFLLTVQQCGVVTCGDNQLFVESEPLV